MTATRLSQRQLEVVPVQKQSGSTVRPRPVQQHLRARSSAIGPTLKIVEMKVPVRGQTHRETCNGGLHASKARCEVARHKHADYRPQFCLLSSHFSVHSPIFHISLPRTSFLFSSVVRCPPSLLRFVSLFFVYPSLRPDQLWSVHRCFLELSHKYPCASPSPSTPHAEVQKKKGLDIDP